jgi:hypothetical protein
MSNRLLTRFTTRLSFATVVAAALGSVAGCGEVGSAGSPVAIPDVEIICTSSRCRSLSAPRAIVVYTTSGCEAAQFGAVRSGSTDSVACTPGVGCRVRLFSWISPSGLVASDIPAGSYSICATLDFDRSSVEPPEPGDSFSTSFDVTVGESTGLISLSSWSDL